MKDFGYPEELQREPEPPKRRPWGWFLLAFIFACALAWGVLHVVPPY